MLPAIDELHERLDLLESIQVHWVSDGQRKLWQWLIVYSDGPCSVCKGFSIARAAGWFDTDLSPLPLCRSRLLCYCALFIPSCLCCEKLRSLSYPCFTYRSLQKSLSGEETHQNLGVVSSRERHHVVSEVSFRGLVRKRLYLLRWGEARRVLRCMNFFSQLKILDLIQCETARFHFK